MADGLRVRRVAIVLNRCSGAQEGDTRRDEIAAAFARHGSMILDFIDVADSRALAALGRPADGTGPDVVVAAGGDGTINTVANALAGTRRPMGILPFGTFNYVARRYGLPDELEAAIDTVVLGRTITINAGEVAGRLFLNNCSLGLYTSIIDARERHERMFGRTRTVAALSGILTVLSGHRRPRVRIDHAAGRWHLRTSMVFIGANPLQLDELAPEIADQVDSGALAIVVVRAIDAWRLIKFAWRALFGAVLDAPEIEAIAVQSATVSLRRRRMRVVVDGELIIVPVPFEVKVRPDVLCLRAPAISSASSSPADR